MKTCGGNLWRKGVSLLLCVMMCAQFLPAAFANDEYQLEILDVNPAYENPVDGADEYEEIDALDVGYGDTGYGVDGYEEIDLGEDDDSGDGTTLPEGETDAYSAEAAGTDTLMVSDLPEGQGETVGSSESASANQQTDGTTTISVSDTAAFMIAGKPVITGDPQDANANVGSTASFAVAATGVESYEWQYRSSGTGKWKTAGDPGCNTDTLTVTARAGSNGFQFRCGVTNGAGTAWSEAATLTVNLKPAITEEPVSAAVGAGKTVSFSVAATGAESYNWQYRSSETGKWKTAGDPGCKTDTLTVTAKAGINGFQFRCGVTNQVGTSWSKAATLTVVTQKPNITAQPRDAAANEGTTVIFSVTVENAESFHWQYRKDAKGTWKTAGDPGCNTDTLTVTARAGVNGFQFRCGVTNQAGTTWSEAATLKVNLKPKITVHPVNVSTYEGAKECFSIRAEGAESYDWQYRKSTTGSWKAAGDPGCKTNTLTVTAKTDISGYQFRCVATNSAGTTWSEAATLTVLAAEEPKILIQPSNLTSQSMKWAVFTVKAAGKNLHYEWENLLGIWNGKEIWESVGKRGIACIGADTDTFKVPAIPGFNGYRFRCRIWNDKKTIYTNAVTLTVR